MAANFQQPSLAVLFLIFAGLGLQSCQANKPAAKTLPAPGRDRLPQIYVFWDSSNTNLKLPWAPPNPDFFVGEASSSTGFEARVVVENSSDLNLLENRLRDWNSRPNDLIIVGPTLELYKKLLGVALPSSQASGQRIFVSNQATVEVAQKSGKNSQWQLISIAEEPVSQLLTSLCTSKFANFSSGCRFSDSSSKRPALAKLPAGALAVQFSDFQEETLSTAPTPPGPIVSLALAWDHLFSSLLPRPGTLKRNFDGFDFSDGSIRLKLSKQVPEEVSQAVKILSLPLVSGASK